MSRLRRSSRNIDHLEHLFPGLFDYILNFNWIAEATAQAFASAIRAIEGVDEEMWEPEPEVEKVG